MYKKYFNLSILVVLMSCSNQVEEMNYPEAKKLSLLKIFMAMKSMIHTGGLKISLAMILLIGSRDKINLLKHLSVKISTKKI
jgi:hypothetical protein